MQHTAPTVTTATTDKCVLMGKRGQKALAAIWDGVDKTTTVLKATNTRFLNCTGQIFLHERVRLETSKTYYDPV